jgi:hypothetical protein
MQNACRKLMKINTAHSAVEFQRCGYREGLSISYCLDRDGAGPARSAAVPGTTSACPQAVRTDAHHSLALDYHAALRESTALARD